MCLGDGSLQALSHDLYLYLTDTIRFECSDEGSVYACRAGANINRYYHAIARPVAGQGDRGQGTIATSMSPAVWA